MGSKSARGAKSHRPKSLNSKKANHNRIRNLKIRVANILQQILECQFAKNRDTLPSFRDSPPTKDAGKLKLENMLASRNSGYPSAMPEQITFLSRLEKDHNVTLQNLKAEAANRSTAAAAAENKRFCRS